MVRAALKKLKVEFEKQSSIAIVAAFGFLIALVWRDFITELVNHLVMLFNLQGPSYLYKLISALFITFLSVVGILIASKMNVEEKK